MSDSTYQLEPLPPNGRKLEHLAVGSLPDISSGTSGIVNHGSERVRSIDALRGFDMFWIMGADTLVTKLCMLVPPDWLGGTPAVFASRLSEQMEHVEWEGFRFYDLIFPMFLMLVGCSIPFSMSKLQGSSWGTHVRILRRTFLLVLMGLIYNQIQDLDWGNLRWMGVLQRIGICYGIAALLAVHLSTRGLLFVWLTILAGYWAILTFVPVPGGVAGDLSAAGNLSGYLDRTFLPGKILEKYYGFGDNEGMLSTLPAVATVLIGIGAGKWLQSNATKTNKAVVLFSVGLLLLAAGYGWGVYAPVGRFPIIKNLWTSSFVLVAGGWSILLLGLFYSVIDGLGFHRWAWLWMVIGANAITIYMMQRIVSFRDIADFLLGAIPSTLGDTKGISLLIGMLFLKCLVLALMYRNKIFLRL